MKLKYIHWSWKIAETAKASLNLKEIQEINAR